MDGPVRRRPLAFCPDRSSQARTQGHLKPDRRLPTSVTRRARRRCSLEGSGEDTGCLLLRPAPRRRWRQQASAVARKDNGKVDRSVIGEARLWGLRSLPTAHEERRMPTLSSPHRSRPPSPGPAAQRWRARGFPAHARTAALGGLNLHALLLLRPGAWCRSRGCQQRDHYAHTGKAPSSIRHRLVRYPPLLSPAMGSTRTPPHARPRGAPERSFVTRRKRSSTLRGAFRRIRGPRGLPPKQPGSSVPATFRATTLAKTDALRRFGRFVLLIQHLVGPT